MCACRKFISESFAALSGKTLFAFKGLLKAELMFICTDCVISFFHEEG